MALTSKYDASGLTQADGTELLSWPDLSASNNPAVSSSPRAPLVKTNAQNSRRGVLFDGVDDWIHWHPANADQISRFVVVKWLGNTSAGNGTPRIWDGYQNSLCVNPNNNSLRIFYWRSGSNGEYRTPAGSFEANKVYLVEVYRDKNNIAVPPEIWINGVQQTITTVGVESGIATNDTFIAFGNVVNDTNGMRAYKGYVFEARFFNTILTDSARGSNRSEMLTDWGIIGSTKANSSAANEGSSGIIPEIIITKDTVRGKINYSSSLVAVRSTVSPSKLQTVTSNLANSGKLSRKLVRKKVPASINLVGSSSSQITNLTGTILNANLSLSGRLIPAIVVSKKHHCKECIKRWAHRWFSRSD